MPPTPPPYTQRLIDHLFRRVYGQLVSTLTRLLGSAHIDIAENIAQDAFLKACETWPYHGVPENPAAWLTRVAKNGAIDHVRRERMLLDKGESLVAWFGDDDAAMVWSEDDIGSVRNMDDQLAMMFLTCQPCLSRRAQVSLTLKTVSGFSAAEISRALLTSEEATRKLLIRARKTIRDNNIAFELPPPPLLQGRVDAVLDVLYLLFNEGYSGFRDNVFRRELSEEAIRLTRLFLLGSPATIDCQPKVHAVLALMLLHSARMPARQDIVGELVLLSDQDRSLWDGERISLGMRHLSESAQGTDVSAYHLEARIAAAHVTAPSYAEADWPTILACYDQLMEMKRSPVVALNRAVAVSMVAGVDAGMREVGALARDPALQGYYLLPATLADFCRRRGDTSGAAEHYRRALELVGDTPERRFLERRLAECTP